MWARTQEHKNTRTQEHTKLFKEGLICQSILDLLPKVQKNLYYYMVTMILSFCSKQKDRVMKLKNRQKDIFKNSGLSFKNQLPFRWLFLIELNGRFVEEEIRIIIKSSL